MSSKVGGMSTAMEVSVHAGRARVTLHGPHGSRRATITPPALRAALARVQDPETCESTVRVCGLRLDESQLLAIAEQVTR